MVCFTVEGSISLEKEINDDKLCPWLLSHEILLFFLHYEEAKEKIFLHFCMNSFNHLYCTEKERPNSNTCEYNLFIYSI